MRRLICRFRGHTPFFWLNSSTTNVTDRYETRCMRCGRLYQEKVWRLS